MNRRTPEGFRLRVLIDAIADARATTDAKWLESWIPSGMPWMSRQTWIDTLERMVVAEATTLVYKEAA